MCLIFTILGAFPIGYLVKQRAVAVAIYLAAYAIVFSFQTLNLLMEWLSGSDEAFGAAPKTFPTPNSASDILAYGAVNTVIALLGGGLVVLGGRTAAKRAASKYAVTVGRSQ